MRVLNWIFGIPNTPMDPSGNVPASSLHGKLHSKPASIETKTTKKNNSAQRAMQRDQVSSSIREVLRGADIQSSAAKFKIMTVDPIGIEFIALVELGQEVPQRSERASELGASIVLKARQKFGVTVKGIYWKLDDSEALKVTETPAPSSQIQNLQHDREMALMASTRQGLPTSQTLQR